MSKSELAEQAEALGIEFDSKMSAAALQKKINAALGEIDDVEPEVVNAKTFAKEERITIICAESEMDKRPVVVGVNGRNFVMQRGKPVSVPLSVIEVLNHATKTVWDDKMTEYSKVPRYPYQVVAAQ
jgi:hypothetical protein